MPPASVSRKFLAPLALGLALAGCTTTVHKIKPLTPRVFPFDVVTLEIDYGRDGEPGSIRVTPEMAIIYVEPQDRQLPQEVLWRIRCTGPAGDSMETLDGSPVTDCLRPGDRLVLRPKGDCSTELFHLPGETRHAEISIPGGSTFITSGAADPAVARRLFAAEAQSDRFCDGTPKYEIKSNATSAAAAEQRKSRHGKDLRWVYEVKVMRGRETILRVDPEIWIEKDD